MEDGGRLTFGERATARPAARVPKSPNWSASPIRLRSDMPDSDSAKR